MLRAEREKFYGIMYSLRLLSRHYTIHYKNVYTKRKSYPCLQTVNPWKWVPVFRFPSYPILVTAGIGEVQKMPSMLKAGHNKLLSRVYGCLVGLAVGDAVGMPIEGFTRQRIKKLYGRIGGLVNAGEPCYGERRLAGSVTDDTMLNLLVAEAVIDGGGMIRRSALSRKLVLNVGRLHGVGPTTSRSLARLRKHPNTISREGVTNGGAMRAFPLGLASPLADKATLLRNVVQSTILTHGTDLAIMAASAVAFATSAAVEGKGMGEVLEACLQGADLAEGFGVKVPCQRSLTERIRVAIRLAEGLQPEVLERFLPKKIGTSIRCDESVPAAFALVAATGANYEKCVLTAANMGGDTDTIACISGGLCGAYNGVEAISNVWRERVEKVNKLKLLPVAEKLLEVRLRNTIRAQGFPR